MGLPASAKGTGKEERDEEGEAAAAADEAGEAAAEPAGGCCCICMLTSPSASKRFTSAPAGGRGGGGGGGGAGGAARARGYWSRKGSSMGSDRKCRQHSSAGPHTRTAEGTESERRRRGGSGVQALPWRCVLRCVVHLCSCLLPPAPPLRPSLLRALRAPPAVGGCPRPSTRRLQYRRPPPSAATTRPLKRRRLSERRTWMKRWWRRWPSPWPRPRLLVGARSHPAP